MTRYIDSLNEASREAIRKVWGDRFIGSYPKPLSEQIVTIEAFEMFGIEKEGRGDKRFIKLAINDLPGGRDIYIAKDGSEGWERYPKYGEGWLQVDVSIGYAHKLVEMVEQLRTDPAFKYTDKTIRPSLPQSALVELCARADASKPQPAEQLIQ